MAGYNHEGVEKKWQQRWEESGAFKAPENPRKDKKAYILDMFPYPSGAGLHVGHVEGYTATDIYSRYKRMQGFDVLHPMGWDAFGLPAENYAIKTGIPPQKTTDDAIATFTQQIKNLGLSYDWSREVAAHTPEYYKWTQWFFLFLYNNGLAYKKKALVNWDPVDQTVLANEQVLPDGTAERSGAKVEKKDLEQWFFKITDFADALIDDLDQVDWPESTKINQRNWIGRSEGAEIEFAIAGSDKKIQVFTTRPDTLFGATYMVLAPEHPEVEALKSQIQNWSEAEVYIAAAKNKSDIDRSAEGKEKTGVELKGIKAINPANKEEIPVYIADYVLGTYGTGAIMAVPAHDARDFEFAKKFRIKIQEVITNTREWHDPVMGKMRLADSMPFIGNGTLVNSAAFTGYDSEKAKTVITDFVGGKMVKTYRLRDWLISRQRYWGAPIPVVYDPEGNPHPVPEEHLPWMLPTDVEFKPTGTSPLGQSKELLERTEKIFGKGWRPEVDTMDTFVCSSWYYYRFADPCNDNAFASKEEMQKWLPVDLYMGGAEHTVLHLLYARFFTKALQKFGHINFSEPFLKLRHQGTILAEDGTKMSKSKGNVINPDEVVAQYGADTLRLYEMFMGPLEMQKPWNTKNILGVRRFLDRVWKLQEKVTDEAMAPETDTLVNQTIQKVTDDIESLRFNTAISALMILLNHFAELPAVPKTAYGTLVKLLYPFAPHMTSEIAALAGYPEGAVSSNWPVADKAKLKATTVTVAVQINGKARASIELSPSAHEDEALSLARAAAGKWLTGPEKKAIYVPGRIVNFVV